MYGAGFLLRTRNSMKNSNTSHTHQALFPLWRFLVLSIALTTENISDCCADALVLITRPRDRRVDRPPPLTCSALT